MGKKMSGDDGQIAQTLVAGFAGRGGIDEEIAALERRLQQNYTTAGDMLVQVATQERKREKSYEISRIDAKMDIMRMRGRPKLIGRKKYDRKMLAMLGYVSALAAESKNRSAAMDKAKAEYERIVSERKEIRALLMDAWKRRLEYAQNIANGAAETGYPGGMAAYADKIAEITEIDARMGERRDEIEAKNRQLLDAENGIYLMEESIRSKRYMLNKYISEAAKLDSRGRIVRALTKTDDKIREIHEKLSHLEARIAKSEEVTAEKSEERKRLQTEIRDEVQTFKQLWAARHKIKLRLEVSEMHARTPGTLQKSADGLNGIAADEELAEREEGPAARGKGRIETAIEKIMERGRTAEVPKAREIKVQKKDVAGETATGEETDAKKGEPLPGGKGRIESALEKAVEMRKAREGAARQGPKEAPEAPRPRLDGRIVIEYAKLLREKEKWRNRNSRLPNENGIRDGFRKYAEASIAMAQAGSELQAIKEIYSLVGWEYNNARRGMTKFEKFTAWMRKPAVALSRFAGGYAAGFGAMALMPYTIEGGIALAGAALAIGAAGRFVGTAAAWEKMHELKTRWFGSNIYALGSQVFYRTKEKKLGRIADEAFGTRGERGGNAAETAEKIDAGLVDYADSVAKQKVAKHVFAALTAAIGCIPGLKYLGIGGDSNTVVPEGKGTAAGAKPGTGGWKPAEVGQQAGKPAVSEVKPEAGSGMLKTRRFSTDSLRNAEDWKATIDAAAGTAEFAPLRSHGVWHIAKAAAKEISGFESLSKHDRRVVVDSIKRYIIDNQDKVGLDPKMVMDIGENGPGLKENAVVRLDAEHIAEAMKKVPKTIRHALSLDRWAPGGSDMRRVAFGGAAASQRFAMAGV